MNLKIQIAQFNFLVGDIEGNAQRIIDTAQAVIGKADAIVFPELAITGYPPEDLLLRSHFIHRVEEAVASILTRVQGIHLVIGYPRRRNGKLYNVAGVLLDGEVIAEYKKHRLPNYSVFDEKRYFSPGSEAVTFNLRGTRIGLTICEDIWEVEPAAMSRAAGAELLLNINASPFHIGKAPEREELVQIRARENNFPIIYTNLVGGQDELVFDGGSFVVNASGQLVERLPFFRELSACVDLNPDESRPALSQMIVPLMAEEERVYQALVTGVRDYVLKNGFDGAIIGLSGGVDSALTLALASDALGPEQIEVVMMPSRYTADMSNQDAVAEAESLWVEYRTISIEPAFNVFLDMLADEFAGKPVDVTEENIQARCRGIILMAISNKKGRILLTTGNKSEMSVGYATLYGDMAGGFAPIKDVPKTLVYRLCHYRNSLSLVIPQRVLERPPSAELAPDQKDIDSLPEYAILDEILERYVESDQGLSDIVGAGFDQATVERVISMVDRNEYKRRQAPPGIKITRRAYGRDRRYPLTWVK
ncbi:MAG: NAD+ synthase [Candidatus Thiodiazotropha sp. (ex Lucinoma aequizonata)]|nr:NAD+ synthase [Candidatus Thiodiazotropha sp. (ex Lucinoma aequizonata)]MCU7887175.1 NAD+ synthase [Candidatus Thiodiazotropha sp. (ex Lucinoma aequizonata)]MCU7894431.1 NAD+ synthase [Candidatus Thiodiazotropha sp. (ex Lucinoma aequizonata)]MCU7898804.1 NAD+ synthase [Candidatus Thiodiazotropha sp. (ex Lucinoma aequizonata)]MCU7903808.1 NAD+ synthase [Candidatus Thiodiazotropha sp. (ex Lucinoma aequizonata)]